MAHHVDNVLPSKFWNKSWLEQSLEQEKPCRIKELHSFVPVFQCSDQEMWFGKVKIKMVRSFEAFCECKAKNHFSPYPLRTVRTLEQLSFRPLLLLYIIYYIYIKQGLTEFPSPRKNLVPVPLVKLRGSEHQNTRNINNLHRKKQGKSLISARRPS